MEPIFIHLHKYCLIHAFADFSSEKIFMGMGGGFTLKRTVMMSLATPEVETMAMALYIVGNISVTYSRVALSGLGEYFSRTTRQAGLLSVMRRINSTLARVFSTVRKRLLETEFRMPSSSNQ